MDAAFIFFACVIDECDTASHPCAGRAQMGAVDDFAFFPANPIEALEEVFVLFFLFHFLDLSFEEFFKISIRAAEFFECFAGCIAAIAEGTFPFAAPFEFSPHPIVFVVLV